MASPFPKLALIFVCSLAAGVSLAADEKKPTVPPAETTDWSKYVVHSELKAKIVKVERGGGLLVEVPGPPQLKATGTGNNMRTTQVPGKPEKFSVMFAEGGLVRWGKLPAKTYTDGKKASYTPDELAVLKQPLGVSGYAAARTDLKVGQIVEFVMIRPRELAAAKAGLGDLLVKRATIVGEDTTAKPAEPPKKKKD